MTIKEMEERTGMSRTNIRFYESEGLITPKRRDNGYREYSHEDAQVLRRVKLLRAMEIPLEEVKGLIEGKLRLPEVLTRLEQELDRQQLRRDRTREAALQMRRSEAEFETLEPDAYLPLLETGEAPGKEEGGVRLNLPWRRYWARCLDYLLYKVLVDGVMAFFPYWEGISLPLTLIALVLLEPLMLMLFGTTPGKAVFGIRVTDLEGGRLSYGDALVRIWTVLWEGEALRIPVVTHYFMYKSLRAMEEGETLPWEWDSELTIKDDKNWRYVLFFALYAAVQGSYLWITKGGG